MSCLVAIIYFSSFKSLKIAIIVLFSSSCIIFTVSWSIFYSSFVFFILKTYLFIFIGCFIYLHFKCYHPSRFPLHKPPIPCPSPCLYEGAPPSIHPLRPHHPSIPLHWGIESPQDKEHLFPFPGSSSWLILLFLL